MLSPSLEVFQNYFQFDDLPESFTELTATLLWFIKRMGIENEPKEETHRGESVRVTSAKLPVFSGHITVLAQADITKIP